MHNNYLTITLARLCFDVSITLLGRVIVGVIVALLKEKSLFSFKRLTITRTITRPRSVILSSKSGLARVIVG